MSWETVIEYSYTVKADTDEPIMLLNKHIGYDEKLGHGIDPEMFTEELFKLDELGKSKITVYINSVGGQVLGGMAIYNAILKTKTKVDTYCLGVAASISAVIFQAGRTRTMADNSVLMLHNPYGSTKTKQIEVFKQAIATMVATRSGISEDEICKLMDVETWLSAAEAKDKNLCDVVEMSSDLNNKRLKPGGDIAALWREADVLLNQTYLNIYNMQNIINALKLPAGAPETQVVNSIIALRNQIDEEKAAKETAEKENETLKTEIADKDAEIVKLTEKNKKLADAAAVEETAAAEKIETEATEIVNTAVVAGRITEESKTVWIEKAKKSAADLDDVKNQLESIAVNKKSPNIKTNGSGATSVNIIANKMEQIREKFGLN